MAAAKKAPKKTAKRATAKRATAKRATAKRATAKRTPAPPLEVLARLRQIHPDAKCALDHTSAFELLVATVLSAQTTDVNVNRATPKLFARWPNAKALAAAEPIDVEPFIASLGFFRMKAKSLVGLARRLVELHGGDVPRTMAELVKLPGVGRKTANVVLGVMWNTPEGVVVDTHVQRLSQRLGWTKHTDPVKIEQDLMKRVPEPEWDMVSHLLIFHGRRVCFARKPDCEHCGLREICPSAFRAENVGRKPPRARAPAHVARGA